MRIKRLWDGADRGSLVGRLLVLVGALALLLAGCGGQPSGQPSNPSSPGAAGHGSGPVAVLYAGSLVNLMEHDLGPKFSAASGYSFQGQGGGSNGLANQIKGKVKQADVFISASPQVNDTLRGEANGNWVSWYATFATAPLVLGYSPNSRFAAELKAKPWQQVIAEPGFRLGRTDPATDPKGALAVQALQQVGLANLATGTTGVFPETELVGRLQAGQLDAGFFYRNEAVEAHIPTLPITPVDLSATYTVTVLNNPPHQAGAVAFVNYLLGDQGAALLGQHGLQVVHPPTLTGDHAAVSPGLQPALGG